jgi:hypothetical protein
MQGDAREQSTSIVRGVATDHGDGHTNGSAEHAQDQWREPKGGQTGHAGSPAAARRVFVTTQNAGKSEFLLRRWPLLALIAIVLGVGVVWLTIGRGPSEADLERHALRTNFGQLQEQVQALAAQVDTLNTAKEHTEDRFTASGEQTTEITRRLYLLETGLLAAEQRSTARVPIDATRTARAAPSAASLPTAAAPEKPDQPAAPVLTHTFRNIEIRLVEAERDGAVVRMSFVATATGRDTPLTINNNGARLNFADGTRYARYSWIITNEWRRSALVNFELVADVPRRFTIEWQGVQTDAEEVAVMELVGNLRVRDTAYAMKFTRVPLE